MQQLAASPPTRGSAAPFYFDSRSSPLIAPTNGTDTSATVQPVEVHNRQQPIEGRRPVRGADQQANPPKQPKPVAASRSMSHPARQNVVVAKGTQPQTLSAEPLAVKSEAVGNSDGGKVSRDIFNKKINQGRSDRQPTSQENELMLDVIRVALKYSMINARHCTPYILVYLLTSLSDLTPRPEPPSRRSKDRFRTLDISETITTGCDVDESNVI